MRTKTIYCNILNQGEIRTELNTWILQIMRQDKYNIIVNHPSDKPISSNRNKIVQKFLANKEYDYLMMIDSDVVPPMNILNLVDFQKDIISPVCFILNRDKIIPLVMKKTPTGIWSPLNISQNEGLIEVDAVGTGCIILSRKILEAVKYPFKNEYDADGIKKYGLDFNFCQRAKKLGFKVYCHLDYLCQHWIHFDLKLLYAALFQAQKKEDATTLPEIKEEEKV
jgi:hypothetical protein